MAAAGMPPRFVALDVHKRYLMVGAVAPNQSVLTLASAVRAGGLLPLGPAAPAAHRCPGAGSHDQCLGLGRLARAEGGFGHAVHQGHLLTAVAMNMLRISEWLRDIPRAKTRQSAFTQLMQATA